MNLVFKLLAPQTWFGGMMRVAAFTICIFLANIAFCYAYDGQLNRSFRYYCWQSIWVGGPFVALFFATASYQLRLQKHLSLLSRKDGLTGLNNRRTFLELAERRLLRTGQGVLLLIDADHFKRINDAYGHGVGDKCLQNIAHKLQWHLRQNDVVGRIGGEEFAVLLACATIEQARVICERLSQPIPFRTGEEETHRSFTLSIGAVVIDPLETLDCHLNRADQALYEAKEAGRACLKFWAPTTNATKNAA